MSVVPARAALLVALLVASSLALPLTPPAVAQAAAGGSVRIQDPAHDACGTGGGPFGDVAAALACAASGATVLVEPGTHTGALRIGTSLVLCSTPAGGLACDPRAADTVLDGGGALQAVVIAAADVTLRGFTLRNPTYGGSGAVAPSLVLVDAPRAQVLDNVLREPAAPLALSESRAFTAAIHVASGDDVRIERNAIQSLPPSRQGTNCADAPCRTVGILHAAGAAPMMRGNRIDMAGAGDSAAIQLGADGARVEDNTLRLAAGSVDGAVTSVGIRGPESTVLRDVVVRGNDVAPSAGALPATAYGTYARLRDASVEDNSFRELLHGVFLRSVPIGDNAVRSNTFERSGEGLRDHAPATLVENNTFVGNVAGVVLAGAPANGGDRSGATLRGNTFHSGNTVALRILPEVSGVAVDARENDWSVYTRAEIRDRIDDSGSANAVDVDCFIDADHASRVCPPTVALEAGPEPQAWGRDVAFHAAIVEGGRPVQRIVWDFGDGTPPVDAEGSVAHAYATPGEYTVRAVVTDEEGYHADATRNVTVVNHAPTLAPLGPLSVPEGHALHAALDANDADGDALAWTVQGLPDKASFDAANATLAWTPTFDQMGNYSLRFEVTDGIASAELHLDVEVTGTNAPPRLEPIGTKSGREGEKLEFHVHATDPDTAYGQALRLQAVGLPPGATWIDHRNGTALFQWQPDHLQSGNHLVAFEAHDGQLEVRETVTLAIENANRPPTMEPIATREVDESESLGFFVSADDPDGSAGLAYGARDLPRGAAFDAARRLFTWTPAYDQAGTYVVTFTATDGVDSVEQPATLVVHDTNRPPHFHGQPPRQVTVNRTTVFGVQAIDPDGDRVTYDAIDLPENATFNRHTRVLSWRPVGAQVGTHDVTFVASDGAANATLVVRITVEPNRPPVLVTRVPGRVDVGVPATFSAEGSYDPEEGARPVTYLWTFEDADDLQPRAEGASVSWSFPRHGVHNVTLEARDGDGFVSRETFQVVVDDVAVLTLRVTTAASDPLGPALAQALFTLSDGTPVAGARVVFEAYYQPTVFAPRSHERAFTATTDEHGLATLLVPNDTPLLNLPGRHVLTGSATSTTSFLGDAETASSRLVYGVLV